MNLYFFKSAKHITENEASREGHEKMVPSLIASQIFRKELVDSLLHCKYGESLTCSASGLIQDGCLVQIPIFFDGISVLNDSLGAIKAGWHP